jgi:hypothetical protein
MLIGCQAETAVGLELGVCNPAQPREGGGGYMCGDLTQITCCVYLRLPPHFPCLATHHRGRRRHRSTPASRSAAAAARRRRVP